MRILDLHIDGFGKFHDLSVSFDKDLNVVYGKNEAGKSGPVVSLRFPRALYAPLCQHRVGHCHEAGDVRAFHVVHVAVRLGAVLDAGGMDVLHD